MAPKTQLICKPLDSLADVEIFLQNPPPWRSLCIELVSHSKDKIRNIEINSNPDEITLENPQTFCHLQSDAEEEIKRQEGTKLPKTLVCHDMANGYHDDSFINGTGNCEAYTFYNWGGIDIFCYFSHHFITIPPLGWINVGHSHGVQVLGTIITEWNDGAIIWEKLLSEEAQWKNFASSMVAIAKLLKLDGWLLNIENEISKPQELLEFVKYFHKILHEELKDPLLIWYDSVTVEGKLQWQNGLTAKNKALFEACDGLFTNYSWTVQDVKSSAQLADERLLDLYIGIDVWGRNFYGDGMFNTQKAIKVAHESGCSLAIFAPAWTHEGIRSEDYCENTRKYEMFLVRDRALWDSLWPFLSTKLPCSLPFQTSFCRGHGRMRYLHGEVIGPVPWYNLRHMQYQPNSMHGPHGYLLTTLEKMVLHYQKEAILQNQGQDDISDTNEIQAASPKKEIPLYFENEIASSAQESSKKSNIIQRKMTSAFKYLLKTQKTLERQPSKEKPDKVRSDVALACIEEESECVEFYSEDAYTGGSCLRVNPTDATSSEHRTSRLFHCDWYCEDSLIACVATKTLEVEEQHLNVVMSATDGSRAVDIVLVGANIPQNTRHNVITAYPLHSPFDLAFRELQQYILLQFPGFYMPVENSYGWRVRYFSVPCRGLRIKSVNVRTALSEGSILLGHFGLCQKVI